jgi:hypothetical protein
MAGSADGLGRLAQAVRSMCALGVQQAMALLSVGVVILLHGLFLGAVIAAREQ